MPKLLTKHIAGRLIGVKEVASRLNVCRQRAVQIMRGPLPSIKVSGVLLTTCDDLERHIAERESDPDIQRAKIRWGR